MPKFYLKFFLLVLSLGVICALAFSQREDINAPSAHIANTYPLLMKGVIYKNYTHGKLSSMIEIGELKIKPKRLFIFTVKSVNEALLNNVTAEFYIDPLEREKQKVGFANSIKDSAIFKNKSSGFMNRVKLQGVNMKIFHSDVLTHTLEASYGSINLSDRKTIFKNATLKDSLSNKMISAKEIIWDSEEQTFEISGIYKSSPYEIALVSCQP